MVLSVVLVAQMQLFPGHSGHLIHRDPRSLPSTVTVTVTPYLVYLYIYIYGITWICQWCCEC